MTEQRAGRPRASSREMLAEAACELFLEQGFEATTIADISRRAGVSRSSFFNYFASKSDILWAGLDERIARFEERLEQDEAVDAAADVRAAAIALAEDFAPDSLALAERNAAAMGLEDELEREASSRRSRIARAVAARLGRAGADRLHADVAGAAWGGAVLGALEAWAHDGAGRTSLDRFAARAADVAALATRIPAPGAVRQLRMVVQAPDFDATLAFYRDVVGMPQAEAYEAEGGARVAILDAGRATLELANPGQVAFIDRVETDGGSSDRIRVAFEVDDTVGAVERLAASGARVEASARETPWRSVNARLRAPADLQVTLFQELGPA
ncbi:TetR family transcriptional regulator [Microbacterium sp. cf046]|uniref:TetR family transcriptional regulator n=1 Tax=Microbacterium sp. cf046 TaxID=1761803 RepID=UPI000B83727C|nr:TetR family transcriptional regulator [Microbacterium sp. cf046]